MNLFFKFLATMVIADRISSSLAEMISQDVRSVASNEHQALVARGAVCDLHVEHAPNAWFYSNALHFLDDFITREGPQNIDKKIDLEARGEPQSQMNCGSQTDTSFCPPPTRNCTEYANPALYFIQTAFANFHSYLTQFQNALTISTLLSTLNIGEIVNDFPEQIIADNAKKANTLAQLGAIFGAAAGAIGVLPNAGPFISGGLAIGGALVASVGGDLGESQADIDDFLRDIRVALENRLSTIFTSLQLSIGALADGIFNVGHLPAGVPWPSPNGEVNDIAAWFTDGKYLQPLPTFQPIQDSLTLQIRQMLVGQVLASSHVFILANSARPEDQCQVPGARFINNMCFTLEIPGTGPGSSEEARDQDSENFSRPLAESIVAQFSEAKYQIDLVAFYNNNFDCTINFGYEGKVNPGDYRLDGSIPQCFFNLPTFKVDSWNNGKGTGGTPCEVLDKSIGLSRRADPIKVGSPDCHPGINCLPEGLSRIFNTGWCYPVCTSHACNPH